MKRNGFVEINPANNIKAVKTEKKLPSYVEFDSMQDLFDLLEFDTTYPSLLDKCLLHLLYGTGMRLSELTTLKTLDVDLFEGAVKVTGKRNKQRLIPLHHEIVKVLKEYLELRNKEFPSFNGEEFFLTSKGKPLYNKFVYRRIREMLSMITTMSKRSPHVIRHTFATHMLNAGADLNAIKEILGHANLAATQVYTHNSIEKLKSVYKQAHPKA